MIKLPFIPKILVDILGHIPTIAFKTINLYEVFSKSATVLSHLKEKEVNKEWLKSLGSHLPTQIELKIPLDKSSTLISGEDILRLYFAQFKNDGYIFLDLRGNHFYQTESRTFWCPSTLVYKFDPQFQAALVRLYQGFYYEDEKLFWQSLADLGLTENLTQEQSQTLMKLFQAHFGTNFRNYQFKLSQFQESFAKVFEFFLTYKVQLKTDFLYLGLYLTTLYMNLERTEQSYNVEKIFLEIFPKPNA
jgi:predicted unusual protein kinase regulating ubiquinone biosynthesis (AarF/ABC1/UbiB family)